MRASLFALALSSTVSVVLAFDHHVLPARGLHAERMAHLVKRQSNGTTPAVAVSSSPAAVSTPLTTSAPAPVASSTPSAVSANTLAATLSPASLSSSDTAATVASTPSSSAAAVTSSSSGPATTSSAAATKSAASGKVSAVTSTSTQIASGSSSASDSAASSSGTSASDSTTSKKSSGIGHTTLIIIIVIASCIAGIAAIWTIIRKTKFSPSRRFEAKLAPIEFGGRGGAGDRDSLDGPDAYGPGLAHARSQSAMSSHSGANAGSFGTSGQYPSSNLVRSDSGGNGSLRGAPMTEVSHLPGSIPYSQSSYTGAQPSYYAGQSPYGAGAAGYPAESYNANGQYADLQRGPSTASARPYNGAPTGGYNYAAHNQAAQQQRW